MVGDVGGKVGGDAVGTHQHFVLGFLLAAVLGLALVGHAVLGGVLGAAIHNGAVLGFVAGTGLQQLVHHGLDCTALVQVTLVEPDVVLDAVLAQVALQTFDVLGQSIGHNGFFQLLKVGIHIGIAVHRGKFLGALDDVGALVAFGGQRAGLLALVQLQVADGQALAELFDLVAGVVDIELPGHVIAGPVQAGSQAVAQGAAPGVAHMHGAGGIGGNKFHVVAFAGAGVGAAVFRVGAGRPQNAGEPLLSQEQVDEAGARDVHPGKQGAVQVQFGGDGLGDLAGRFVEGPGAGHGQVGRHVAVLHVGGNFHNKVRQVRLGQGAVRHGRLDGIGQQGTRLGQGRQAGVIVLIIHSEKPPGWIYASDCSGDCSGSGSTVMATRLRLMKFSAPESSV